MDELVQVRALGGAEAQSAGQRVEDLTRRARVPALLQEGEVGRGDRRERGDLLPPQAGCAAPGARGSPTSAGRRRFRRERRKSPSSLSRAGSTASVMTILILRLLA
ncbi:hypothetical protein GCM10027612_61040 [Microbispora bryophytorum subsp. camponoti]